MTLASAVVALDTLLEPVLGFVLLIAAVVCFVRLACVLSLSTAHGT